MRGKLRGSLAAFFRVGLIPAYAGKTAHHAKSVRDFWAHPRVCGENPAPSPSTYCQNGSSPRMRGKRVGVGGGEELGGLIPAYAGKTMFLRRRAQCRPAHPRVCGENDLWAGQTVDWKGSSPRMRGKRGRCGSFCLPPRLIPAYAGKTLCRRGCGRVSWAHPRVCGENGPEAHAVP